MLDRRTLRAVLLGGLVANVTQAWDWSQRRNVIIAFAAFYCNVFLWLLSFWLITRKIRSVKDPALVVLSGSKDGLRSYTEQRTTAFSYDMKRSRSLFTLFMVSAVAAIGVFVGLGYVPALFLHAAFGVYFLWTEPLVRIHVLRQAAVGACSRPFGSNAAFASSSAVREVKDSAELEDALRRAGDKLVLLDFYADWCGPCQAIAPAVEKLADDRPNLTLLRADIDGAEQLATTHGVKSVPTFVFFRRKRKVETLSGGRKQALEDAVDRLLRSK